MSDTQADLGWLAELPEFVAPLAKAPLLREVGLTFVSREDGRSLAEGLRNHYAEGFHLGTLWLDSVWEECQERTAECVVVARGPARIDILGIERMALLILRRDQPAELWLAWSDSVPASLWIPCGRSPESIHAAVSEFEPPPRRKRHELECRTRLFMGYRGEVAVPNPYSGELVAADPHDFARHFTFSPVVEPHHWGSSCVDNPWPDPSQETLSQVQTIIIQREVTRQAQGGICSFTRLTKFSGSYLGIELHLERIWVWNILHPRSRHGVVIEQLNARHGTSFPTNLPFDVVAAMLGFAHVPVERIEAGLRAAESSIPAYLEVLAALQCTDLPAITRLLRSYLDYPELEVRGTVAELAARYGWLFLLEELLLGEPEASLREWAEQALPFGAPEQFDEYGEPLSWAEEHEHEEDA